MSRTRIMGRLAWVLALAAPLSGAGATWTGPTGGEWGDQANWDPVGVPNAPGAVADINTALTVAVSDFDPLNEPYPYTFGKLATSIASGGVVIGTTAATTDILRAQASTGVPEINVANGGGTIFFYANLEGSQGFEKTGAGKLTWRFNGADQDFTGDITISGGILGINQNSSLGDDANDIFIAGGARLLAEPGSNSGTITLPDTRTITLTGAQSQIGSNNAAVNLVVEGLVTEDETGRGLVKTDAGKVTLAGTLSYTGETRIAGGTLALSGSAALPSGQNLRFNGATGTLDLGGASQTVRTIVMDNTAGNKTVTGGGGLTINGDANLDLKAANGVSHDFSGLDSFTFNRSNRELKIETVNADSVTTLTDVYLAKSGANGGVNTITADRLLVGGGTNTGNNGNTAQLHLGTENTVNTATFQVGAWNAGGVVDFQSGLTNPFLKLRGTDGASAVTAWKIGETSSGNRRGEGVVNLTGGTLDALVSSLTLGRHIAGSNWPNDTSSLTMPGGSLVADTIVMAEKINSGTPTLTATLTQEGGSVTVGTLTMGVGGGTGLVRLLPTYRLWGGTLTATTIQSGGGTFAGDSARNLILRDGVLTHNPGNDLTISGVTVTVAGVTTTVVETDPGRKVVLGGDVLYSARIHSANGTCGALTVAGDLDLSAQPSFWIYDDAATPVELAGGTKLVLIDYSLGSLTGAFSGLAEGDTYTVTKDAVTNTFVIAYADLGGTAVTLTVPSAGGFADWAAANGIPGEPFDGDFSNDGIPNGLAYALGLDPTASSHPVGVLTGDTLVFTKGSDAIDNADVEWIIEVSETLADDSWVEVVTQPAGDTSPTIEYTLDPGVSGREFARLRVVQVP